MDVLGTPMVKHTILADTSTWVLLAEHENGL